MLQWGGQRLPCNWPWSATPAGPNQLPSLNCDMAPAPASFANRPRLMASVAAELFNIAQQLAA
eukprot:9237647-Lingulodinium_polyedra.AAC.1